MLGDEMARYNTTNSPQAGVLVELTAARHCCGNVDVDAGAGEGVGDDVDDFRNASAAMHSNQRELCPRVTEGNGCSVHGVEIPDLKKLAIHILNIGRYNITVHSNHYSSYGMQLETIK